MNEIAELRAENELLKLKNESLRLQCAAAEDQFEMMRELIHLKTAEDERAHYDKWYTNRAKPFDLERIIADLRAEVA